MTNNFRAAPVKSRPDLPQKKTPSYSVHASPPPIQIGMPVDTLLKRLESSANPSISPLLFFSGSTMYQQDQGHDGDETNDTPQQHAFLNDNRWSNPLLYSAPNTAHGHYTQDAGSYPNTRSHCLQDFVPSQQYTDHVMEPVGHDVSYRSADWGHSPPAFNPGFPYLPQDPPSSAFHDPNCLTPSPSANFDARYPPPVPTFTGTPPYPLADVLVPVYSDHPTRRTSHPGSHPGPDTSQQLVDPYGARQQYTRSELTQQISIADSEMSFEDVTHESPPRALGDDFIHESFPEPTPEHGRLRSALAQVMTAPWRRRHTMEPDEDLLLQFTYFDKKRGRWNCSFTKDGTSCRCSTRKKDHAKGHIRWHIDHRPYFCKSPCPTGDPYCNKQYTAMESLKKHQNGKAKCSICGATMLKGNLQRHRTSSCKAPSL